MIHSGPETWWKRKPRVSTKNPKKAPFLLTGASATHVSGPVLQHVTMCSQARGLQQLVDAVGCALSEAQVPIHNPGCVSVNQHSPLKTQKTLRKIANNQDSGSVSMMQLPLKSGMSQGAFQKKRKCFKFYFKKKKIRITAQILLQGDNYSCSVQLGLIYAP